MLKIRLQRIGRSKRPNYRVVVTEHTSSSKSNYIEKIGYYDPLPKDGIFKVDTARLSEWIKKGAKPTNTVARLLKGSGAEGMDSFIIPMKDRKKKKEPEVKEEAPKEEVKDEPEKAEEEKPAEEKKAEETAEVEATPAAEEKPEEQTPEKTEDQLTEEKAEEDKKEDV